MPRICRESFLLGGPAEKDTRGAGAHFRNKLSGCVTELWSRLGIPVERHEGRAVISRQLVTCTMCWVQEAKWSGPLWTN